MRSKAKQQQPGEQNQTPMERRGEKKTAAAQICSPSDLDPLNSLADVLQQRLVLRALVLVLVGVHVSQSAHIRVKVLLVHRFLSNRTKPGTERRERERERVRGGQHEGKGLENKQEEGNAVWKTPFLKLYRQTEENQNQCKACRTQERDGSPVEDGDVQQTETKIRTFTDRKMR